MKTFNNIVQEKFELNQSTKRFYINKFSDFLDKYENDIGNYTEFGTFIRFNINESLEDIFNNFIKSYKANEISTRLTNIIDNNKYSVELNIDKLNSKITNISISIIYKKQIVMSIIYTSNKSVPAKITLSYDVSLNKDESEKYKDMAVLILDYIFGH